MSNRIIAPLPYSKEWWRVTLSSIGDGVIVTDEVGRVSFMNPVAENLTGWTDVEANQKPLEEVFKILNESGRTPIENPATRLLATGSGAELASTLLVSRKGIEISIENSASPIRDAQGKTFGVVVVFRDVSAKKQAQTERAYLASIIESSDDAIIGKTLDSVITSWNTAAEHMFGYSASEAVGKQVYLIIPTDRHSEELDILARLRRGERIEHYETVRRKKDGSMVDVSLTVSPIRNEKGKIVGASKIARDITETKKAQADLKTSHETLEIINRVGKTLSTELNLEKIVQSLTDSATALTGAAFGSFFYNVVDERGASYMLYTLSGVPLEHFKHFPMPRATDLFGPTFRGEGAIRIAEVKQDPRYGKNSPYFGMPEGHLPVTSYLAVPVVSHTGHVLGGLFFGHPKPGMFSEQHEQIVTGLAGQAASAMDNARLYEEMREARADSEAANRLKDEFLATVSHELRTPLNAILGWARLLHTQKLDEESRARAVETIERSAVAQGQIIEDILDVSRIITGKLRLDVSPVEIGKLINDALDSLRPTAETKGVKLQTVLDTKPNLVWGDAHRLQQIFWNLLSNAVKFTPKNGRVQVTLSQIDSQVEITVSDTGKGIAADFLPYVFERFRQADSSTTRTHGGLGLGLAIVRHLTELHGGTVTADSPGENLGATFKVVFPVAILREGRREEVAPPPQRAVQGQMPTGQELRDVRVLVVDDEPDACELLKVVLERSGAEVRAASNAAEAFSTLKQWKPDVLLSDIGMPREDGFQLIQRVRALSHKEGGSIPAAALTAYATPGDRLRVLTAGFQTHVPKPVEPMELVAIVAILSGKRGIAKDR